jgi:hypothetical protein
MDRPPAGVVVIVDDDDSVRQAIDSLLRSVGFRVVGGEYVRLRPALQSKQLAVCVRGAGAVCAPVGGIADRPPADPAIASRDEHRSSIHSMSGQRDPARKAFGAAPWWVTKARVNELRLA